MDRLISENKVLEAIDNLKANFTCYDSVTLDEVASHIKAIPSSEQKWIPMTTRPMTEEEMTFYSEWAEYGAEIFDCPLPEDGQEVLVSYGGYVCVDTFCKDDGCYFEGVDIGDVDAWMPLPMPYKPQEISYTVEQDLNEYKGNIEIIEKKY